MKKLNERAKEHLDRYIQQMRQCLRKCTTVDADEVERNIIEHIENELESAAEPISFDEVDVVLKRLGSPQQWVPEEEISWWRKILLRLHYGPDDWRLAYLSFGFFLFWLLVSFGPRGFILWPLGILRGRLSCVFLLASFVLSRAAISQVRDTGKLAGQKWLLYPPLVIVYIPLLMFLIWPVIPTAILAQQSMLHDHGPTFIPYHPPNLALNPGLRWGLAGAGILSLWWIVLGIICCIVPQAVRVVFRPFADNFNRKWAVLLIVIGGLIILLCLAPGIYHSVLRCRSFYFRPW